MLLVAAVAVTVAVRSYVRDGWLEIKKLSEMLDEAMAKARLPTRQCRSGLAWTTRNTRPGSPSCGLGWSRWPGVKYAGHFARLADCWPMHPEAVIELSTLMTE
jgi:hypothetical protein